jgi:hypothetical protein
MWEESDDEERDDEEVKGWRLDGDNR